MMMTYNDYKKIISSAIDAEIEAYTCYRAVSDKVKDKNLKDLFSELAGDEEKHKLTFEGFLKQAPDKLHFSTSRDYKVVDPLPTPPLTGDLKLLDGLVIGIKRELETMQMYTQLVKTSTGEGRKTVFAELASMERGHKSRLEGIYSNVAFPEVW